MKRGVLGDLSARLAVIEAGSFTKAADRLGMSQSALSHTVWRLGLRMSNRTTRRVGPTEAGESLGKDMIAGRIGPDMRMAVVAAPPMSRGRDCRRRRRACTNLRLETLGNLYAGSFKSRVAR